jgi:hypothetical protein
MRIASIAAPAILVAALTLASCGGSSETSEPEAGAKSEDQAKQSRPAGVLPVPQTGSSVPEEPSLPKDHPPVGEVPGMGTIPLPPEGSGTGESALSWTVPKGWVTEAPTSPMRKAQYRVPGPGGAGECAVFYFGPGQGGDAMANAERWAGQFKKPDGSSARDAMKTSTSRVGNSTVLMVEVTGTYTGGMTMSVDPPEEQPGSMLLGAIAEGPDANWFFKFTGPEATVRAQRAAFEGMVRSLRSGS